GTGIRAPDGSRAGGGTGRPGGGGGRGGRRARRADRAAPETEGQAEERRHSRVTIELAAFEIPIRTRGEELALAAFDRIDQAGTRTQARVGSLNVQVQGANTASAALQSVSTR